MRSNVNDYLKRYTRNHNAVILLEAKKAFFNGDLQNLDEKLKEADYDIRHPIIRMKNELLVSEKRSPKILISYKHETLSHNNWVKKLAKDLRNNGINALLDEWEVDLGESISDFMACEISKADAVLFIITKASVAAVEADRKATNALRFEFQIANAQRYKNSKFRMIGLLRIGERPPSHLSDNLYIDFRDDENYENQLQKLVKSLHGQKDRPRLILRKEDA